MTSLADRPDFAAKLMRHSIAELEHLHIGSSCPIPDMATFKRPDRPQNSFIHVRFPFRPNPGSGRPKHHFGRPAGPIASRSHTSSFWVLAACLFDREVGPMR
jgi:hypothetical protein